MTILSDVADPIHRPAAAVSVDAVSKVFGRGAQRTVALQNVSLDVAEGELLCILGRSGCGKSTLLNLIAGLEAPTQRVHQCRRACRRHDVPGCEPVPMAHGRGKHRSRVESLRCPTIRTKRSHRRIAGARAPARRASQASPRTIGRDASTRRARPVSRSGLPNPADGRAVRRARCHHARRDARSDRAHLGRARTHDRVRDAQCAGSRTAC